LKDSFMKQYKICILLFIGCICCSGTFAGITDTTKVRTEEKIFSPDGPYLFHLPDGGIRCISIDTLGVLQDITRTTQDKKNSFPVFANDKEYLFDVKLHPVQRQNWNSPMPGKVMVMSDPHGNLECLVSTLRMNGVIDNAYCWTFGSNHLLINGDVFDRGKDVLPIFWLLYKLEEEAQQAGGQVSFLLGNHEPMILAGDLRYMKEKYKVISEQTGIPYEAFFGENTELGHWLGTRNTMQMIGPDLYVHAGLGKDFLEQELTIPQVNEEMSRGLFMTKEERNELSPLTQFLYGTYGPIWYRGMVRNDKKYVPLEPEVLDRILERYQARRVIVGHTIFPDIRSYYNGKVITVNVDNKENFKEVLGRGILIEGDHTFVISDKGILRRAD